MNGRGKRTLPCNEMKKKRKGSKIFGKPLPCWGGEKSIFAYQRGEGTALFLIFVFNWGGEKEEKGPGRFFLM